MLLLNHVISTNLISCILTVVRLHFRCNLTFTLVNINEQYSDIIKQISENSCYKYVIRNNISLEDSISNEAFIIRSSGLRNLAIEMEHLSYGIFWKPTSKFIIIIDNTEEVIDIYEIFKVILNFKILNVIVLYEDPNKELDVYTYFPYEDGACGRSFAGAVKLGNCSNDINYYPDKLKNGLNNCTINIAINENVPHVIFPDSKNVKKGSIGLEQYVLETIASIENFKVHYVLSEEKENYGVVLNNHTSTGLLHYIQSGQTDIALGGMMLIKNRANYFDFIWGHSYDGYTIFIPRIKEAKWKMVFKEFSLSTWLLILCTFIIFVIMTLTALLVVTKQYVKHYDHASIALTLWGYFFINPSTLFANNRNTRLILVNWIWFTFFINSFYSTSLYSLTTSRRFELPLENLDNIVHAGYKPCVSIGARTYLLYAYNLTFPDENIGPECNLQESSMLTVSKSNKLLFSIESYYTFFQRLYLFIDNEGEETLNPVDYIWRDIIVPYVYRGFPFISVFQKYARHIFESGILRRYLDFIHLKNGLKPVLKTKKFRQLYLKDLKIAFIVLFSGYVLALAILLYEKFSNKSFIYLE